MHTPLLPRIETRIQLIRGLKVIVDTDLASLYGVSTKAMNQAVKRNAARFPPDFMFRLTAAEKSEVVTNCDHLRNLKYSRTLPCVFTEHGAIQAANVLNSTRAVEMSVFVVRAFVQLRELLSSNKELAVRLDQLEARIEKKLNTHDQSISAMLAAIRELMKPPASPHRGIGFTADLGE